MISSAPCQTLLEQANDEMGGACSTHRNACRVFVGKPEGKHSFEENVNGRII
jgi:hypothetical protein